MIRTNFSIQYRINSFIYSVLTMPTIASTSLGCSQVSAPSIHKNLPRKKRAVSKCSGSFSCKGGFLRFLRHILLYIFIEEERKPINRFYPDASFVRGFFHAVQGLFVRTGLSSTSANPTIFNWAKCCYRKANSPLPANGKNSGFPALQR